MTWILTLPYKRPPDGLSANWRGHWRVKARATAEVRTLVVALARSARITTMQRMEVELVWVVKTRTKRDPDNIFPLLKAVCDALGSDRGVSARLVQDDSPEWMAKLHPRIEYRPGEEPRFEVHVTDITHRPDGVDQAARRTE